MTETYSQFGCPGNNFLSFDNFNLKIIIDPPKSYFKNQLLSDRKKFDKLLYIIKLLALKKLSFYYYKLLSKYFYKKSYYLF